MADALKDQGNKAFQAKDYDKAIDLFSQAIALDPNNFVLFSNRSAAKAGKRQYAAALEDAEQVCVMYYEGSDQPLTRLRSASRSIPHGRRATHGKVQPSMGCADMTTLSPPTKPASSSRTVRHCARACRRSRTRKVRPLIDRIRSVPSDCPGSRRRARRRRRGVRPGQDVWRPEPTGQARDEPAHREAPRGPCLCGSSQDATGEPEPRAGSAQRPTHV